MIPSNREDDKEHQYDQFLSTANSAFLLNHTALHEETFCKTNIMVDDIKGQKFSQPMQETAWVVWYTKKPRAQNNSFIIQSAG